MDQNVSAPLDTAGHRVLRDDAWTGLEHMTSIEVSAWTPCGYAIVRNVSTHELADRMESFFLSETLKYMYLLFDTKNFLHHDEYVFSTEGHPFRVSPGTRMFGVGSVSMCIVCG